MLDPEVKQYIKFTLQSMPDVLRSYSDQNYD